MPGSRRWGRSSAAATRRSRRPGRSCPEASRAAVTGKGRRLELAEAAGLVRPRDTVACGFAAGEPVGLLDAIGARPDLEDLTILAGLLVHPHAVLGNPAVRVLSGFDGLAEFGRNRVHLSEVDGWVEHAGELVTLPAGSPSPPELAIARHVAALVDDGATLQFGIGAIPDEVARLLASGPRSDLGIHTEMVSDGVMRLHAAGKVTNRKGLYDGVSVGTFALGSPALYDWLGASPDVRMLPVGAVNDPALMRKLRRFVSINGALAIDLAGQVAADHVAGRQYSGVGGHEAFVVSASEAPGGKSIVCLKSTATVAGERVTTIVPALPSGTLVTTPRH